MSGASLVCTEFINMMAAIDRLDDAARILGHLDAAGWMGLEGPGFKVFVVDAADRVAADARTAAVRAEAAAAKRDERRALTDMRDVLDELPTEPAVASP